MTMSGTIEIENGIPLLPIRHDTRGTRKYPWRKLSVMQSFFVPDTSASAIALQANHAASRIGGGIKFACRTVEGGTRVWRIA